MEELSELLELFNQYKPFYIATFDGKYPRVRPFGVLDLYQGHLYIQTGAKKDVSRQLKEYPYIEICSTAKDKWIRICAEVRLDESIEAQEHVLDSYPQIKNRYKAGDGNNEVYQLVSGNVRIYNHTEIIKEFDF